jgi:hypothetical protein
MQKEEGQGEIVCLKGPFLFSFLISLQILHNGLN